MLDESPVFQALVGGTRAARDPANGDSSGSGGTCAPGSRSPVPVPEPDEPVRTSLRTLARIADLGTLDRQVLTYLVALRTSRLLRDFLASLRSHEPQGPEGIADALAVPVTHVLAATHGRAPLVAGGLARRIETNWRDANIEIKEGLSDLVRMPGLDAEQLLRHYLDPAPPPTLEVSDFARLADEVELAERLLGRALETRRPRGQRAPGGSPPAPARPSWRGSWPARLEVPLYVAGLSDGSGRTPSASDRLSSLQLGHQLLARTPALLLFDELEDVFVQSIFPGASAALMSKQWFNAILEGNPVPTIWISNDVDDMDPAFLRRFGYVIRFPSLGAPGAPAGAPPAPGRGARWPDRGRGGGHRQPLRRGPGAARLGGVGGAVGLRGRRGVAGDPGAGARALGGPGDRQAGARPGDLRARRLQAGGGARLRGSRPPWRTNSPGWTPGAGGISLCLYGPPGTGKSAYVRYLAWRMGRPVVARRGSDLLGSFLGETERAIADAFREAEATGAVLLFDEVDALLRDRRGATHGWELSVVDEVLQQLESFGGVVACTTNLWDEIDPAALRRFLFKVELKPLDAAGLAVLVGEVLERALTPGERGAVTRAMRRLAGGDRGGRGGGGATGAGAGGTARARGGAATHPGRGFSVECIGPPSRLHRLGSGPA